MTADLEERAWSYYNAGKLALEQGKFAEAIRNLELSLHALPHFKTAEMLGECLLREDRPVEAILYFGAAAGLGKNAFRAKYLLAQACLAVDRKVDAFTYLQQAVEMNPDYRKAKELLEEVSKSQEVRAMFEREKD